MATKKSKSHSNRPVKIYRGNAWQCKCGEFNIYENLVCWASKFIPEELEPKTKELTAEQKAFISKLKPQSERPYSDGLGDIEEFFAFLDE